MSIIQDRTRQRRQREMRQRIAEDMEYRSRMRGIQGGQKELKALIDSYTARAIEAEKSGNHNAALRLAAEAQRLKRFHSSSGDMRSTLEAAHAMRTTSSALMSIINASGNLMEATAGMMDPAALGNAQAGMLEINEQMRMMQEQNELMWETFGEEQGSEDTQAGEAALNEILAAHRKSQRQTLQDMNRKLDNLQSTRAANKERSKRNEDL